MSSSFRPAWVTQYTSASNPLMWSFSFWNSVSGISSGKQTSSWSVASQLLPDEGVDVPHDLPAVGCPDVHALDRVALVGEIGQLDQLVVPLAEVLLFLHLSHLRSSTESGCLLKSFNSVVSLVVV